MAVQYNSENDSWTTWLSTLKKDIPKVSKDAKSLFKELDSGKLKITDWQGYCNSVEMTDETLISFLRDNEHVEYATKDLATYQLYLKNTSGSMTLFQRATKAAGTATKKLFATLGSMAVTFAITEGIQLVINGFSKLNDLIKENKHAIGNSISENYERASNTLDTFSNAISRTEDKISNLEGLRSKLDSTKNSEEDFYALSDDIYDATGYWVNGIKDISSAYETVTKKIDDTISKSKEYEKYLKSREHEKLKNKLENSGVIVEDDDGNKTVYDFGGIKDNPNTITDFDIQFGDNSVENIKDVVDKYLKIKQEGNKDIIFSSQDYIDAYAKILSGSVDVSDTLNGSNIKDADMEEIKRLASESGTSAEEIYAEMFSSVIRGIINEDGVMPDTLPSEEDFKNSITSTVEDYLEYYKDIISKSEFFSEDEFKEIITTALLSGNLTERNIDEFGETLEELSKIDSEYVGEQFKDSWANYYSASLDKQEEFKNEIINKYKEFLEKYGLNNDFLNNFLANLFFNSQRDSNKPDKGNSKHKFSDFLNTSDDNELNKKISEYKTKTSEIAGYLNTLYDGDATSDTLSEIAQKYGIVANSTEEYIEKLEKLQKTDKNSVIKDIDEAISQCDKTLDKDVINKLKQLKIIIENYYNDTNSKMSEIKRVKEDIDELSEVQKKVKKGHIFSVDEMATLIDKYPELKKAVIECSNGYKIESETLKDVMNSSKESANAIISDEIRKTKIILKNTQANITAYEGQLLAYEGLVTALDTGQPGNAKAVEAFMNALDISDKIDSEKKNFKKTKEKLHELEKLYSQTISTSGKDANDKSDSKTEKSIETIDFIEIKIKRLESAISKLKSKAEDTTKSLGSRIKNYASAISKTTSEIIVQQKAYDKYMSKANNVAKKYNLSRSTISKIQDGSIDIKDYSDTTAKHIKSYQDFYEKAIACKDAINELKLSEQALMRNKLQLHIDYYKNLYDSIGTSIDKINNKISLKESANQTIKKSDYKGLGTYYNKQYRYLEKQNSYLVKLQSTVKKGSEEWYKYHSQIDSNNTSIRDLTSTIIDNANAMAELNKQVAEKKVEKLDSKDKYSDAKIANANSYKTKNSLIDNKMSNISLRQKAYNNTVKQDKVDLNGYRSNILKSKVKGNKNLRKIKSYVKSNKAIPVSLIEKLTNKTLATSCANYNATLQALETDKETAKLYKETSKTDKANLVVDKFNNISTNYDNKLSVYSQRSQKIEDLMDLNTSKGYKTSAYYYNNSINNELNNYNQLIKKRKELQSSLNESLKNGTIKMYDDNWWEMTNDINNVTNAITQSKKQLVEFNNTLKEIEWNRFDDLQSAIKGFASENDFMIKELSRQDLADDDIGKLTKNGNAVMALHNSNYEIYTRSAQKYAAKIQEINKELKNDPGNTKLIEEKEKLVSAYQESISSAQDEKDAIIDLTKNGYTSLQNKIKDLIDDYTKLLDKQKNAYDYSNSINEKTEKIANLRKQLEAYSGDISEEGKAKIQSISVSLKDAEKDLQSTQYDKYISDTKDMLSELQDSLSDEIDKIIKSLKDNFNTIHIDVKDAAETITNKKKAIGYQSSSDFSKLTSDFAKGSDIESATDKVINAITSRQNTINEIADNKGNIQKLNDQIQKLNDQKNLVKNFINNESKNKSKTTNPKSLVDTNKALYYGYKKVLTYDQWEKLGDSLGITISSKKDLTEEGALYKKLKKLGIQGFSVGSHKIDKNQLALLAEEGMELHFDKSRGVLKTIGEGDKIFTNEMTENLWKLAQQNPVNFKDMSIVPILPSVNNSSSKGNVNIDIGNITLPSVTKPEEFAGALKDTIKTNSSVQKQLQELTIGTLNKNNNSLGIRRF